MIKRSRKRPVERGVVAVGDIAGTGTLPSAGWRPPSEEPEVWLLKAGVHQTSAAERAWSVLDSAEQDRADAFLRPGDRATYLVAHVGLRFLLGGYLGLTPQDVAIARAACPICDKPHGRPVVAAEPPLHFSLSHTREVAVCSFAASPVGVDIETNVPDRATELVRHLHPAERAAVEALPRQERNMAFLRCWVRKEAYLKGLGVGLGVPLDSVDVGLGPAYPGSSPTPDELDGWGLAPFDTPSGSQGAVAVSLPSGRGEVRPVVRALDLTAVLGS